VKSRLEVRENDPKDRGTIMENADAIVTGGTGLVGRWLVTELSAQGRRVTVLARKAAERKDELHAWVAAHGGNPSKVELVSADLAEPDLGLSFQARAQVLTAKDIFHLGGAMAFGLDAKEAALVNERGTEELLELAAQAKNLRRFVFASGFRAALPDPSPAELAAAGVYEATKIRSDRAVERIARARGIPTTIVRLGTVIGDSRTGETTQIWGFADVVRALGEGKMPFVPGGRADWMPLVTVDFVARFLAGAPAHAEDPVFEAHTLLDDATPAFGDVLRLVAPRLGVRAPRFHVPAVVARAFVRLRDGHMAEGLRFIGPERYDTASMKRLAARMGLAVPSIAGAIERNVDFLVRTEFGSKKAA
jgi:nucleoside-diphosphate-sugar epimerase